MLSFHRDFSRSGLSRTELLVLIAILLLLALVAWGPINAHLEEAKINRAVESARTINTLLSQYATDNNGVYPVGEGTPAEGKSEGIALNLLENNYTPDATIFAVGSTPPYRGKASDFSDITEENISWDFTAGATATMGITSAAPDLLPTVYTTGETVDYSSIQGRGLIILPSGKGPFGYEGIVVAYKGGVAMYIPAKPHAEKVPSAFIMSNLDFRGAYTQIKP